MSRTLLTAAALVTLSALVGCADDQADALVALDQAGFAKYVHSEAEKQDAAELKDWDGDGKPDAVKTGYGKQQEEREIMAGNNGTGIHCDPTADSCPELPLFPLGPQAMTASSPTLSFEVANTQSDLFFSRMGSSGSSLQAAFAGAPDDIVGVYVVDGGTTTTNVGFTRGFGSLTRTVHLPDQLLFELANGDLYLTEPGTVEGGYLFVD